MEPKQANQNRDSYLDGALGTASASTVGLPRTDLLTCPAELMIAGRDYLESVQRKYPAPIVDEDKAIFLHQLEKLPSVKSLSPEQFSTTAFGILNEIALEWAIPMVKGFQGVRPGLTETPQHSPLTDSEVGVLLDSAQRSDDINLHFRIQERFMAAIPGVPYTDPSFAVPTEPSGKIIALLEKGIEEGNLVSLRRDICELLKPSAGK